MPEIITSLKEPLLNACSDVLGMFGLEHKFLQEIDDDDLNSSEEINIHIGMTQGLHGNIIFQLSEKAALMIVSAMMGGMEFTELDEMGQSAISEFANMLMGNTLGKLQTDQLIDISPPSLAIGNNVFLIISKARAKKMFFELGDTKFCIAYSLE